MKHHAPEVQTGCQVDKNSLNTAQNHSLRILRCTAQAMANGPGGLHFVPGAKPWLEGLALFPRQRSTSMTTL
jgi:hypothetical protein